MRNSTYNRVFGHIVPRRPYGHAERNADNLIAIKQATKEIKEAKKCMIYSY